MYKCYILTLLSIGASYTVVGMTPQEKPYLSKILPPEIQEHIIKFVADAPNLETAVKNIRRLLETNHLFRQFTVDIINYISQQSYVDSEDIINATSEEALYQGFKKILVALRLATPQAYVWLREYAQQHPDIVGEYAYIRQYPPRFNVYEVIAIVKNVSNPLDLKRYDEETKVFTPQDLEAWESIYKTLKSKGLVN